MRTRMLLIGMVVICLAGVGLSVLNTAAQTNAGTPTPAPTPSPTQPAIVFSANGQPRYMYDDRYGIYQLYLNTDLDDPLTDRTSHYIQPRWSPDGTRLAFAQVGSISTPLLFPQGLANSAIAIMDVGARRLELLTAGDGEYAPDWLPDGENLVFASWSDRAIYRINTVSGERQLIHDGVLVRSLDVAPTGERLLVTLLDEAGLARVYMLTLDDTPLRPLFGDDRAGWDAVWSPDGTKIALVMNSGIVLTEDEGVTTQDLMLTGFWSSAFEDGLSITDLAWSPTGTHLAASVFSRRLQMAVSTPVPLERVGPQLMVIDIATGEVDLLTYGFSNIHPAWQPVTPIGD